MSLRWDETMVLGIEDIDDQHKIIIEKFTELSEAFQAGKGADGIMEMIAFLNDYAERHFALEDQYMLKYSYPKIDIQRKEHSDFTRDVRELRRRIQQDGASREIAIETSGKMIRWIIQHISSHDREMVSYVIAQMAVEKQQV